MFRCRRGGVPSGSDFERKLGRREFSQRIRAKYYHSVPRTRNEVHYALQPDAPGNTKRDKYSFRFDMLYRSIVYTGDTGPSAAVERLAQNADILISEIVYPSAAIAALKAKRPDLSPAALAAFETHFANSTWRRPMSD